MDLLFELLGGRIEIGFRFVQRDADRISFGGVRRLGQGVAGAGSRRNGNYGQSARDRPEPNRSIAARRSDLPAVRRKGEAGDRVGMTNELGEFLAR